MSEPERILYTDAPPRQYGPGWRPLDTPAHLCSECSRLADDAEQRGLVRPKVAPVLDWVALGRRHWGALCLEHAQREGCWRFQRSIQHTQQNVKTEQAKQQREEASIQKLKGWLAKRYEEHAGRLHAAGRRCVCMDVTRDYIAPDKMPFSVMMGDELIEYEKALGLHPCSGQCGRNLIKGVGKCYACTQGHATEHQRPAPPMPPVDWHDFDARIGIETQSEDDSAMRELRESAERAKLRYDAEKAGDL